MGTNKALRCIEAEEKRKTKAEKAKQRKTREEKPNLGVAVNFGRFFAVELGKNDIFAQETAHSLRCAPLWSYHLVQVWPF